MFRNQYDNDVTTWSPQGRLLQVEYAMEAVKQGSATIGLKSSDYAVLLAIKRSSSEFSAHQKKIFPIDDHVGMSIAGLTIDARTIGRYLRNECLNERFHLNSNLPVNRLVSRLGNKMQASTQRYDRRPYGVGLLIAGYDQYGPQIYQICPSANYFGCRAMAIGARSQSARTYLEKNLDNFSGCSLNEIVKHGLLALRECLPNDLELNVKNVSVAIVGKGTDFTIYDDSNVEKWLELLAPAERKGKINSASKSGQSGGSGGAAATGSQPTAADTDAPSQPAAPVVEDMAVD